MKPYQPEKLLETIQDAMDISGGQTEQAVTPSM